MFIDILKIFAILCIAIVVGKLVAKIKLPAILGWLVTGIVFGPYLVQIVSLEIIESVWYKVLIKVFECFAGVMIGREIIFKKIARSGKQIIGITYAKSAFKLAHEIPSAAQDTPPQKEISTPS